MKLASIRELSGLRPALKDQSATGPDPVYWVFSESTTNKWENVTIITSGSYNGEYPKTYGHYHPEVAVDETYHLIEGEGVLLMQKKKIIEGKWIENQVEEVYLIKAKPEDEIVIKNIWGHSWSNIGTTPLLSYDDWRSGHTPRDYEVIEKLQGMAYYLIEDQGEVKAVPNPHYEDLPEPKWVSAQEFKELTA